jgi:tetratricopeptide (TPR) repeat protein
MAKNPIDIKQVSGDAFGIGVSGSDNIIGKNIRYNIVNKGNVIQVMNPSKEFLSDLKTIQTTLTEISSDNNYFDKEEDAKTRYKLETIEKHIDGILQMVKRIEDEKGVQIQELRAGRLQFSRVDLLLKRAIVLVEQADRYWNVVSKDSDINMYKSKHKEAYSLLQEANQHEQYNTEVLLYMAKVQCKLIPDNTTQMRKTLSHIQKLLAVPDNDTELFHLAEATFLLGTSSEPIDTESLQDARELFKRLGRRDWVRKCDGLLQADDYNNNNNNNIVQAKLWNNRGTALANLGKHQQAIECFDKAIEINPNDVNIWNSKGTALANLGKHQQAIECFDKAIEINPNDVNIWNSKGTAFHYLSKYQQAIECFDKAIEVNPNDADAWSAKGHSLNNLKKYHQAIECFDKAIEINPNDADAWYSKGVAFDYLIKHTEAIECYEKALAINPDQVCAWYGKGGAFRKVGKHKEAIECYEKALAINPEDALAWYSKGLSLDSLFGHKKAEECFSKAKKLGLTI